MGTRRQRARLREREREEPFLQPLQLTPLPSVASPFSILPHRSWGFPPGCDLTAPGSLPPTRSPRGTVLASSPSYAASSVIIIVIVVIIVVIVVVIVVIFIASRLFLSLIVITSSSSASVSTTTTRTTPFLTLHVINAINNTNLYPKSRRSSSS